MKPALISLLLALNLLAPQALAEEDPGPDWGYTDLDQVRLGTQLVGPPLSHYDLRGKVVVCYHWCITCPISTGLFPYVNSLVERYGDRGLAVVGFQVRRSPDVLAENVMWLLRRLRPEFPVTMLGNDWDWPARYLGWAIVFDHEGNRIFGGNLQGIEAVIEEALDAAPDYLVGGSYEKLAPLAARIVADREHAGPRVAAARAIAGKTEGDLSERAEARRLVECVERYFRWQLDKAEEDAHGVVEQAEVLRRLAEMFEGDRLGAGARERLEKIESAAGFKEEVSAHRALMRAKRAFRDLPPAGRYAYDMEYGEVSDEAVLATRSRMIAEFRVELERIVGEHAETQAASDAKYLLFEHEQPEITSEGARSRLLKAETLLAEAPAPCELFDARLLLCEIVEGYFGADEVTGRAKALLDRTLADERLPDARAAHLAQREAETEVRETALRGGGGLPRAEADRLAERLERIAEEAGSRSRVAERARAFGERLVASYDGPAQLGVAFDRGYAGEGAKVGYVYPASAAERGGVRPGDVILGFDGVAVADAAALAAAIAAGKPGQEVRLRLMRKEGEITLPLVLGRRP